MARENTPFRDISYLQLWQPACLAEQSYLLKGNFVRGHYEEHCMCTSAQICLSFQLVEILTLKVSLAEIYSFIYHDFKLKYDILDPYTRIS